MNKRNLNIDLIRCFALLFVISVHFFSSIEFYDTPLEGIKMLLQTVLRTFFMICVPLFLLLTGYLMNNKKLTLYYYKGVLHTLFVYITSSIICILFSLISEGKNYDILDILKMIFNFSAARYSWYINMYIGLYLLIPFLNIIWHTLKVKKDHIILLITLFICVTLPTIIVGYGVNYWMFLYPILYYYVGIYLKYYPIRIKPIKNFVLLILFAFMFGIINFYISRTTLNGNFIINSSTDWMSYQNLINSVLFFVLVLNIKLKTTRFISFIISTIAKLSLGAYLVSSIFDEMYYTILRNNIPEVHNRILYYPIVIFLVFFSSIMISQIIEYLYILILYLKKTYISK
ncbi:acyltransferase [Amedibacillus sp. YH-ame10]